MKNLSKEQQNQLKEEFLKELLNSVPVEVLESLKDDIDQAIKEREMSQEEEYKLIHEIELEVIELIMSKGMPLSANGTILLMMKLMLGIDEALKDSLGEEYNYYRQVIEKTLDIDGEDNK